MKTDLKDYKFVVEIPSYGDVYDYCYKELENVENVYLIKSHIEFKNKYENWLYCHHFTNKFWLPFRGMWNSRYYNNPFNKNDKIIFVLSTAGYKIHEYKAFKKLRKKYPNCKIILKLDDLVDKIIIDKICKRKNLHKYLSEYDFIYSFDYNDCENYNLIYNPLVYSAPKELENVEEDIDVYFCGKAKDRLELILSTFKQLKEKGFKCKFFINGVSQDKRENIDGLVYLDKFMSYEDNLDYVKRSKCLLEVMQEGGNGYTLRTCEAVAYNKKLITNNYMLKNSDFYDCDMISFFEEPYNIDTDFINKEKKNFKDRNYFSPIKLLEKIIDVLEKENNDEKEEL